MVVQRRLYCAIIERKFEQLQQSGAVSAQQPALINIMIELRKCCIHLFLVAGAEASIFAGAGLIGKEALHDKGAVHP
jgi:hypothetical protein